MNVKRKQSYHETIQAFDKKKLSSFYREEKNTEKNNDHDAFRGSYKTRKMTFKKVKYV